MATPAFWRQSPPMRQPSLTVTPTFPSTVCGYPQSPSDHRFPNSTTAFVPLLCIVSHCWCFSSNQSAGEIDHYSCQSSPIVVNHSNLVLQLGKRQVNGEKIAQFNDTVNCIRRARSEHEYLFSLEFQQLWNAKFSSAIFPPIRHRLARKSSEHCCKSIRFRGGSPPTSHYCKLISLRSISNLIPLIKLSNRKPWAALHVHGSLMTCGGGEASCYQFPCKLCWIYAQQCVSMT